MKTSELNQMENVQGGRWSWSGCAAGAISAGLTPVIATMWNPALALGVVAFGCVVGAMDI